MNPGTNVLFITTDQHRADSLGCYGNQAVRTPNLDRLAKDGIRYENAICQAPVCAPARASWLTGQYIASHGLWANGVSLPDSPQLLPRLLLQAGYSTAMIGKLHITPAMASKQPMDGEFGYETMRLMEGDQPGSYRHWLRQVAPSEFKKFQHSFPPGRLGDIYELDETLAEELHPTRWVADQAIAAWNRRVQHRPTFMHISFSDPHHPFAAPPRLISSVAREAIPSPIPAPTEWGNLPPHFRQYHEGRDPLIGQPLCSIDRQLYLKIQTHYYAMINFVDEEIGRVLKAVEQSNSPTLIIFTSDHGELLGDHGLLYKGLYHYDSLLKVPLIVSGCNATGGKVVSQSVQQIDIMPSILSCCGVTVPPECQGRVLPGLYPSIPDRPYDFTLTEQYAPWYSPQLKATTLRSLEWKLTLYSPHQRGELYHLAEDPTEQNNVWDKPSFEKVREDLIWRLAVRLMENGGIRHRRPFRA